MKDINSKYAFAEFKSNVNSAEEYKLYDENFNLISDEYIKRKFNF